MSIFQNPFFSVAGQLERLANVKNTLIAAVTGQGVKSNTGNAVVDKALSTAASHPFATAAIATAVVAPTTTVNAIKEVAKGAVSSFVAAPVATKAAVVIAAPIATSAVLQSPKLQKAIVNAPKSLANVGSNVGNLIENPSIENAKKLVTENPIIAGGAALAGIAAVGGGLGLAANTVAMMGNTKAMKNEMESPPTTAPTDSKALLPSPESKLTPVETPVSSVSPKDAPTGQLVATKSKSVTKRKKAKRQSRLPSVPQSLNIRVQNIGVYG